jgi:hypothetical protein
VKLCFHPVIARQLSDSSFPGFKSQITCIPNQNFGVVGKLNWYLIFIAPVSNKKYSVLSNDDPFGNEIMEAIKFRIISEVLNLEAIDWSARYQPH